MVVHCPECNARLSMDEANIGKKGECPKCNHLFKVEKPLTKSNKNTPNSIPFALELEHTNSLLEIDEHAPQKTRKIKCDKYWLSYNSNIFLAEWSNGQFRFPLRNQMALSYETIGRKNMLAVWIRIIAFLMLYFSMVFLGASIEMFLENYKKGIALFTFTLVFMLSSVIILTVSFIEYGLHVNIEEKLSIKLFVCGESVEFIFKNDREEAKQFFLEVEKLSHNAT